MSWSFVDAHVERTVAVPGYWRNLPASEQEAIAPQFWEVGRLTLERWLTPRLASDRIHRWPGVHVVVADVAGDDALHVTLSNATALDVDHVVFACGYRVDVAGVPYLRGCLDQLERDDGFPVLDQAFQTTRGRALHHRLLGHEGVRPVLRVREGRARRRDAGRARPAEALAATLAREVDRRGDHEHEQHEPARDPQRRSAAAARISDGGARVGVGRR